MERGFESADLRPPNALEYQFPSIPEQTEGNDRTGWAGLPGPTSQRPQGGNRHRIGERVEKARSVCSDAVEMRLEGLLQPLVSAFVQNKIDAAELERRKLELREQAESESPQFARLANLNKAYSLYEMAVDAVEVALEPIEAQSASCNSVDGLSTASGAAVMQRQRGVPELYGPPISPSGGASWEGKQQTDDSVTPLAHDQLLM